MVKPMPSWLKSSKSPASTSKKEAPKAESSSKAKKVDQKKEPPVSPRPASPPPAYTTAAPGAMPAGSSRAIARRDDYAGDGHGWATSHQGHQEDSEDDFNDKKGKAVVKRGKQGGYDDDENQPIRHRHKDHSENNRDSRKGKEVMRRGKSRKDASESESESESDHGYRSKKKGKEMVKRENESTKKHRKAKKKQESSSDSDSEEQIVEKRQRFEPVSIFELAPDYVECLRRCFEVRAEKIEKWCDDGLIRMDTKDGSFNVDRLLNSKKVEEDEKKKWAVVEKKYRRYIAETPGGDMHPIPRFEKYLPKGPSRSPSGPSVVVVARSRNPRSRDPRYGNPRYERPRSPSPFGADARPCFHAWCAACCFHERYCGDPFHGS